MLGKNIYYLTIIIWRERMFTWVSKINISITCHLLSKISFREFIHCKMVQVFILFIIPYFWDFHLILMLFYAVVCSAWIKFISKIMFLSIKLYGYPNNWIGTHWIWIGTHLCLLSNVIFFIKIFRIVSESCESFYFL